MSCSAPPPGIMPPAAVSATASTVAERSGRTSVHARDRAACVPLDLGRVRAVRVNRSAAERRIASLPGRRAVKGEAQVAWLLNAVTCIDLTTLNGDDTEGRVKRLCAKARAPIRTDILEALGMADRGIVTGAVCVYHRFVPIASQRLRESGIAVAAVSTGFPAGLSPHELKLREIEASVVAGATEIDVVVTREHVLTGNWNGLYNEVRAFRAACGDAHLKAILATGDLKTLDNVARASLVCMMAGADFIKTSTGKENVNATLVVTLVMLRMIRSHFDLTGHRVGFKPAGGVSRAKDILLYQSLIRDELGLDWLRPDLFRIGASSLLADIERQLEHHVTGAYSAHHRHPLG